MEKWHLNNANAIKFNLLRPRTLFKSFSREASQPQSYLIPQMLWALPLDKKGVKPVSFILKRKFLSPHLIYYRIYQMKPTRTLWMKLFLLIGILILMSAGCGNDNDGSSNTLPINPTLTDIDGNEYNQVTIGTQVWIQENLKVTRYRDGSSISHITSDDEWEKTGKGAWCYYENDAGYAPEYGCLYNWYAASDSRNVCPLGWHVPTNDEWKTLLTFLGGWEHAGGKLKEAGTAHWAAPNTGATNESGFTGLPGGSRVNGGIFNNDIDLYGWWWSSTMPDNFAFALGLYYEVAWADHTELSPSWGLSIRCIQNVGHNPGTFTDPRDGKTYKTIELGTQTWMAQNLNYDTAGGSWVYDDKASNAVIYGRLYNWETACKVCPDGWRLPSHDDWDIMIDYFGGDETAGGPLKETGTDHWRSPNTGATNISGFIALPGGLHSDQSYPTSYYGLEIYGNFWTSTTSPYDDTEGIYKQLICESTQVWNMTDDKVYGYSVRCVKND